MWWKNFFAPGIVFFVAGAVNTPMAAFLIALYFGYQLAAEIVKGRRFLGFPPPEKIKVIGIYIGALLFAELFFVMGALTRQQIVTSTDFSRSPKVNEAFMSGFGDRVRIRPSKETEALGLAGREGEVFGWTTPSSTNVSVIGLNASDRAINVHFGDLDQSSWFSEELIEHLGIGVGTVITLDGVDTEWVRLENGDWKERPRSR